jgi:hypothetical protein
VRTRRILSAAIVAGLCGGCVPAGPAPTLGKAWMIGIEHIDGDPLMLQPATNQFLMDLAARPNTQVVFLGAARNPPLFSAYTQNKMLVRAALGAQGNCMEITYTLQPAGQPESTFGLVIAPLPAGPEPVPACVDRAASDFYGALARQGL